MYVIGTAGHVDHGKSTLVTALTGINPDRLKEEQARSMTIDLGFAWMQLTDGETVGLVDVPGHRDFIENMLAGVGGIDAALFVIAADEGVMPQTREHLAILDLLGIKGGIIALTKCDLIDDPEWMEMIDQDIHRLVTATVLESAPILRVSARTGQGLDELVTVLEGLLHTIPPKPDLGKPRLGVDRVFTMPGFGTVVTGTLIDGSLRVGDEIEIQPSGQRCRVRGLQTHKQKVESAGPGQRTAANLSGVDHDQVRRGEVLTHPGQFKPTRRLDAWIKVLPDVQAEIKHLAEVKVFCGTTETNARLRVLEGNAIPVGQTGWIQLELEEPILAVKQDRFILRRPSPARTIAGGIILDPHPLDKHKHNDGSVLSHLNLLMTGTPGEHFLEWLNRQKPVPLAELLGRAPYPKEELMDYIHQLLLEDRLMPLVVAEGIDQVIYLDKQVYLVLWEQARKIINNCHTENPLRPGLRVDTLKQKLAVETRLFQALLTRWSNDGLIGMRESFVGLGGFQVRYSAAQARQMEALLSQFTQSPSSPPSRKQAVDTVGEDVYRSMLETGVLRQVSEEVVFRETDYQLRREEIVRFMAGHNTISIAEVRDLFQTSRKYAQALLEYLDKTGVTIRDGDMHKLK